MYRSWYDHIFNGMDLWQLVIAALGPHAEFQARCVGFDVRVVSPHFLQLEGLLEKLGKELDKKNPPTSLILPE